jgi:hypothetical protein
VVQVSRRGRPRKTGERYKSGDIKPGRDKGTPELEAKRQQLVGEKGDPVLSTCPLDILKARGLIDDETHKVASDFGGWYRLICGKGTAKAMDPTGAVTGGEVPEHVLKSAKANFDAALNAMMGVSRAAKDGVVNVVIYERPPRLLFGGQLRKSDGHLFDGLRALTSWRRGERRAA